MATSAKTLPPNSLILVVDPIGGEIPKSMGGLLVAASQSCIAVGCRLEADGETEITLGTVQEVNPDMPPAFEGRLKTPSRRLAVRSVVGQTILETSVSGRETTVLIWVNDPEEPDRIIVGVT